MSIKIMNVSVIKTKKMIIKFKIETPRKTWTDDIVCLRRKRFCLNVKTIVKKYKRCF